MNTDKNAPHKRVSRQIEAQSCQQWQPIKTAPKDGTWVILFLDVIGRSICAYYSEAAGKWVGTWCVRLNERLYNPTHWMPLPAPPMLDK